MHLLHVPVNWGIRNGHVMLTRSFRTGLYWRVCLFVLFFVATSASFHGYYEQAHFFEAGMPGAWVPLSFERMVEGTAERPYVYRQLLPYTANLLDRVVPQSVKDDLYAREGKLPYAFITAIAFSPTAMNKVYFFRYLVVYLATFLSALLAVYAMYLVCMVLEMPQPVAAFASVVVILLVPYIQSGAGNFYDYPELAFMALAVWSALKFEWWWAIPIAALGAFNKESFLLVIPTLYPLFRLRSSRLSSMVGVGVLSAICAAIYLRLRVEFAHNPGSTVLWHLLDQLRYFQHPKMFLFASVDTYGMRVPQVFTLLPMALLVWTVWRGWQRLPSVIKRYGQIAAAINIPLYLLFCAPGEMRDLSLLYIVFLLLLAVNLRDWMDGTFKSNARPVG